MDHFCIGYVHNIIDDRYIVVDDKGIAFRANGFRRCKKISGNKGRLLIEIFPTIADKHGKSLWWWERKTIKQLTEIVDEHNIQTSRI